MSRVLLSPFLEASFSISLPPFLFPGNCPHSLPPKYTHSIRSQRMDERTCRYCLSVPRSPYITQFSDSIHFPTNFINFSLCWKKNSTVYTYHIFIIHSAAKTMFSCGTTWKVCVWVYVCIHSVSQSYLPLSLLPPHTSPYHLLSSSQLLLLNNSQIQSNWYWAYVSWGRVINWGTGNLPMASNSPSCPSECH